MPGERASERPNGASRGTAPFAFGRSEGEAEAVGRERGTGQQCKIRKDLRTEEKQMWREGGTEGGHTGEREGDRRINSPIRPRPLCSALFRSSSLTY